MALAVEDPSVEVELMYGWCDWPVMRMTALLVVIIGDTSSRAGAGGSTCRERGHRQSNPFRRRLIFSTKASRSLVFSRSPCRDTVVALVVDGDALSAGPANWS